MRIALLVILFALLAELLGLAHHDHAYSDGNDCAQCQFVHHLPQQPNVPELAVLPVPVRIGWLAPVSRAYGFLPLPNYLVPLAQAPPGA